ncbi:MAG: hypothetical protein AAF236_02335 [Verrucomicrobiota bacterium]
MIRRLFQRPSAFEPVEARALNAHELDPAWFPEENGCVYLRFDLVEHYLRGSVPEQDRSDFRALAIADWTIRLADCFPDYSVVRSQHFVTLAPTGHETGVAKNAERIGKQVRSSLSKVAGSPRDYPLAVLAFGEADHYYSYISAFYDSSLETYAMSGGLFIEDPQNAQIVFHGAFGLETAQHDVSSRVLAHELCHAELFHLQLPMWLEEGITQDVEDSILNPAYEEPLTVRARPQRNREVWSPQNIQKLWTGLAFFEPELNEFAYYFSRALVSLIRSELCRSPADFASFLVEAGRGDAGEKAFIDTFGDSLGVLVEEILGGDSNAWRPQPDSWIFDSQ